MLITLFSIFIAVIIFAVIKKKCGDDDDFWGWGFVVFMAFVLTLFLHAATYPVKLERPTVTITEKIVAMKPHSKIEGEMRGGLFFYRCRIDENDYYVYLTESNEVYKQENVLVDRTVIKETDGQPRIVKTFKYVRNGLPKFIRFKLDHNPEKVYESDTIFVPKGTISDCSKYIVF